MINQIYDLLDGPAEVSVPDEATTVRAMLLATIPDWIGENETVLGEICKPTVDNGYTYQAVDVGGDAKTGTTEPTPWRTTLGAEQVDGDVTWRCTLRHRINPNLKLLRFIPAGVVKFSDTDPAAVNAATVPSGGVEIRVLAASVDNIKFYAADVAMTVMQEG